MLLFIMQIIMTRQTCHSPPYFPPRSEKKSKRPSSICQPKKSSPARKSLFLFYFRIKPTYDPPNFNSRPSKLHWTRFIFPFLFLKSLPVQSSWPHPSLSSSWTVFVLIQSFVGRICILWYNVAVQLFFCLGTLSC